MLIFTQIQRLGLSGDTFTGIIAELPALTANGHNAPLGTQNLRVIQFCTMQAVAAATVDFLSKQHGITSLMLMQRLYINCRRNATVFLGISQSKQYSDQYDAGSSADCTPRITQFGREYILQEA